MVKKLLLTRPRHDVPTSYLHDFCKEIVKKTKTRPHFHITDLEGSRSTRRNVENSLQKEKPGLVLLNGHGDKKSVAGHHNEIVLDEKNINFAKGSIIYAVACDSLENLGVKAIQKGVESYVGYKEKFMLVRDRSRSSSPGKDKNVLPFKKASNTLMDSLVFGDTTGGAVEQARSTYIKAIKTYGTSKDDPYGDAPVIRFALTWNLRALGIQGNPNAVF